VVAIIQQHTWTNGNAKNPVSCLHSLLMQLWAMETHIRISRNLEKFVDLMTNHRSGPEPSPCRRQPPTPPSWVPGGPPPRVCAWCGTRFKIYLCGPPGYPKTVHIARVNSRRFSIGLWYTRTFRGGSPTRRLAHPGGGVSHPHQHTAGVKPSVGVLAAVRNWYAWRTSTARHCARSAPCDTPVNTRCMSGCVGCAR